MRAFHKARAKVSNGGSRPQELNPRSESGHLGHPVYLKSKDCEEKKGGVKLFPSGEREREILFSFNICVDCGVVTFAIANIQLLYYNTKELVNVFSTSQYIRLVKKLHKLAWKPCVVNNVRMHYPSVPSLLGCDSLFSILTDSTLASFNHIFCKDQ